MIQLILLAIGIVALFKKSLAISKKSELRQPKLRIFGIVTIAMFIMVIIVGLVLPINTDVSILVYALSFIIPIIVAVKLKQPKQI